ncbi:MAG: hypothetical protein EOP83_27030 [Verrucomicrobiaceae bacterium]|nr:MAG: hypothetical protein EOP83_27030 [Verrucomicrobiaceae bacterium]
MKPFVPSQNRVLGLKLLALLGAAVAFAMMHGQGERLTIPAIQPSGTGQAKSVSRSPRDLARIEQILRIPDPELRHRHEAILATSVPGQDIPDCLKRLPESHLDSLYAGILLGRWTAANPLEAKAWISGQHGRHYPRLLATFAGAWADEDGAAAIAWARALDREEDRGTALAEIATTLASSEPRIALNLSMESGRPDLNYEILRTWAKSDPTEAARWAQQLPDHEERASASTAIALEWAGSDSLAAADLLLDALPGSPHLDQALVSAISRADTADLPRLRQWVDTFPQGLLKDLSRAELTRIERLLPTAPASLPGEDEENRAPLMEARDKTRNPNE